MDSETIKYTLPISSPLLNDYRDSMRRHYVDDFYQRHWAIFENSKLILDLGGNKQSKRGSFNVDEFSNKVIYLNYTPTSRPDLLADACSLPFQEKAFDCIICAELLEHIKNPHEVLKEMWRVLMPGGIVLLTAPFMFPVHPDPNDYGRYTDQYWQEILSDNNFCNISIEWQGGCWCVLLDILRGFFFEMEERYFGIKQKIANWCFTYCQSWLKRKAIRLDEGFNKRTFFLKGCTTGFGVKCYKKMY